MSTSLTLAAIWVVCAALTAMLTMRRQFIPGLILLLLAPVLIAFIGFQHGVWITLLALLAFVSMFRHPLRYLLRKALGKPTPLPRELERRGE